jgi:serine/threonine protein kinase
MQDALSIITNFLNKDPSRRLGARGDTHSILLHPFFKTVNLGALLQKHPTPPFKPVTLEFLTVNPDTPGDEHDLGRNPSIENRHREATLEQPPLQPLIAKCLTIASGERGNAHESRSNSSFQIAGDDNESPSNTSFKTANDRSVLEGPAR